MKSKAQWAAIRKNFLSPVSRKKAAASRRRNRLAREAAAGAGKTDIVGVATAARAHPQRDGDARLALARDLLSLINKIVG